MSKAKQQVPLDEAEEKARNELFGAKAKSAANSANSPPLASSSKNSVQSENKVDISSLKLDDLNLTSYEEEIDFEGIDDDMVLLKENPEVLKKFYEGADLNHYIQDLEHNLRDVETGTILDYIKEGKTVASLFHQITACDSVLEGMENLLLKFQIDISNIGTQIQTLQDECMTKQLKINNRQSVQDKLHKFVEGVHVPESLAEKITFAEVNDSYLEFLMEFNKRITYFENQKAATGGHALATVEIEPRLVALRDKTSIKVKQFLMNLIHQCKDASKMRTHHKELLKYNYLYQFLFKHAFQIAEEVRHAYRDAASRVYYNYFKGIVNTAVKLQFESSTKNDLLGVDEGKMASFLTGKKTIKNKTSVFSLGIRQKVVDELGSFNGDSEMFSGTSDKKQPYEYLFRNMVYILMGKVSEELMFTQDFFLFSDMSELSNEIFGRSIVLYNDNVDNFLSNTFDAIQLLILIAVIQKYKVIMNKRLVPLLDSYFESATQRLMRGFFHVFELNLNSIKNASIKDLLSPDLRPHYITRRYAEFTVSILYLSLHADYIGDQNFVKKLNVDLSRLREEMEKLLIRLADARYKDWKSKTIYLINNYDLVVSVFTEREIQSVDSQQFQKLLSIKMNDFAQEELYQSFGRLLNFVKENGGLVKEKEKETAKDANDNTNSNPTPADPNTDKKITLKEDEVDVLLKDFNATWKVELEKINNSIIKNFSNFKCGMKVFQKIMEDLLEAYTIFTKIVRKFYKNLRMSKHFTPETEITYEMKKLFVRYD